MLALAHTGMMKYPRLSFFVKKRKDVRELNIYGRFNIYYVSLNFINFHQHLSVEYLLGIRHWGFLRKIPFLTST